MYLQGRGHSIHKGPQSHKGKILQRQFAWGELQHVTKAAKKQKNQQSCRQFERAIFKFKAATGVQNRRSQ